VNFHGFFPWPEKNFIDEKGQAFFLYFREIILGINPEPLSPPFSGSVDRCAIHPKTAKRNTGIPACAPSGFATRCLI